MLNEMLVWLQEQKRYEQLLKDQNLFEIPTGGIEYNDRRKQ